MILLSGGEGTRVWRGLGGGEGQTEEGMRGMREMKRRNKEMFSCLAWEWLAPLDMMDEPGVWRDKSWTDGSDTHSQPPQGLSRRCRLQTKARGTSSGERSNSTVVVCFFMFLFSCFCSASSASNTKFLSAFYTQDIIWAEFSSHSILGPFWFSVFLNVNQAPLFQD